MTALHLATRHPDLVSCLVLEEAPFELAAHGRYAPVALLEVDVVARRDGERRELKAALLEQVHHRPAAARAVHHHLRGDHVLPQLDDPVRNVDVARVQPQPLQVAAVILDMPTRSIG